MEIVKFSTIKDEIKGKWKKTEIGKWIARNTPNTERVDVEVVVGESIDFHKPSTVPDDRRSVGIDIDCKSVQPQRKIDLAEYCEHDDSAQVQRIHF